MSDKKELAKKYLSESIAINVIELGREEVCAMLATHILWWSKSNEFNFHEYETEHGRLEISRLSFEHSREEQVTH